MKTNMGSTDSIIRAFVAIALVALTMRGTISGTWSTAAYVIAAVLFITSFIRICPLYAVLGVSTCPIKEG